MGFLWSENAAPQGFYIGKVINNYDKDHVGMVQVAIHTFKSEFNTMEWMRVISPVAGSKNGFYFLPDVGAEVVVAFIDNDPNNPFVLGSLWNADTYPDETVKEKNEIKKIVTKAGIEMLFGEEEGKEMLTLKTPKGLCVSMTDEDEVILIKDKDDANSIKIDSKNKTINIKSGDKLILDGKNVEIKGSDEIKLDSKVIKLEASDNINMNGSSKLTASGGQVEIKGSSKLTASGAQTEIKASATLKVEGSALTEIKGGMVKVNG